MTPGGHTPDLGLLCAKLRKMFGTAAKNGRKNTLISRKEGKEGKTGPASLDAAGRGR